MSELLTKRAEQKRTKGDCPRCETGWRRGLSYRDEPWCESCQRVYAAEYAAIFRTWLLERRGAFLEEANVPKRFLKCGLDNYELHHRDQQRAEETMQRWLEAGCGTGLYLFGPVGAGKTHLGVAALLELIARRKRGRFISAREWLLRCRDSFRSDESMRDLLDDCTTTSALLLDDLGAERFTEFARETFDVLVDRCYAQERPQVIVTSNLTLDQLGHALDMRVADRLRELCVEVRVGGPSYRRCLAARRDKGEGAVQISKSLAK